MTIILGFNVLMKLEFCNIKEEQLLDHDEEKSMEMKIFLSN